MLTSNKTIENTGSFGSAQKGLIRVHFKVYGEDLFAEEIKEQWGV